MDGRMRERAAAGAAWSARHPVQRDLEKAYVLFALDCVCFLAFVALHCTHFLSEVHKRFPEV
jgi:hypothetical protein